MPTRLWLSCRALLIIVLVRPNLSWAPGLPRGKSGLEIGWILTVMFTSKVTELKTECNSHGEILTHAVVVIHLCLPQIFTESNAKTCTEQVCKKTGHYNIMLQRDWLLQLVVRLLIGRTRRAYTLRINMVDQIVTPILPTCLPRTRAYPGTR